MFLGLFQPATEDQQEKPKFTKEQADYKPDKVLYKCGLCRFFQGDDTKCEIVDEAGEPSPGVILAQDGCAVWNAGPIRQRVREQRFGRGPPPI